MMTCNHVYLRRQTQMHTEEINTKMMLNYVWNSS